MISSLQSRLLLAASIALAGFLGLTGFSLDRAFRNSAETAVRNRLQVQLYGLLGVTELAADGSLSVPEDLPEARFAQPGSGLYAAAATDQGDIVWRSRSLLDDRFADSTQLRPGEERFDRQRLVNGELVFRYGFGTVWEDAGGAPVGYTFSVAENLDQYHGEVAEFRRSLWLWLVGSACVLLLVQVATLGWSLRPLRKVAGEINEVERGEREVLATDYPAELRTLTDNLNTLVRNERKQRERYRNTLSDLAHSLKTPLAVLRGLIDVDWDKRTRHEAATQIDRMQEIVTYQLQRAHTGKATFAQPVKVDETADKVLAALRKVYADKGVRDHQAISSELLFYGDSGDLYEVLGNGLENAFKYGRRGVWLSASQSPSEHDRRPGLEIVIEDDGPGIAPARREEIIQRGVRADTLNEGQGIGLAVVVDILRAYGGSIEVGDSRHGGARIVIEFPPS